MSSLTIAEYALRYMSKPMGVSEYTVTRTLPKELEKMLPPRRIFRKVYNVMKTNNR